MKILEILVLPIKRRIVYWQSIFLELIVSTIICFFYYEFWRAVFESTNRIAIYNFDSAVSYSIYAQIVGIFAKSGEDRNLSRAIQRGSIVSSMLRPIKLLSGSLLTAFGNSIFSLLTKSLPILLTARIFGLIHNITIGQIFIAAFFLIMGQIIITNIEFIIGVSAVWLGGISAIIHMKDFLVLVASGALLPLEFYGGTIKKIFYIMPFHFNISIPVKVFIGGYDYANIGYDFLILIVWAVFITFVSRFVEKKACKKLEVFMG